MFDIGFFELIIIGILALLVLGPERLPKAARTAGMWIGRIKQGFSSIQQEVNQQLHMEEMQRQLDENRRKLEETLRRQEEQLTDRAADPAPQTGEAHQETERPRISPEDEGPFGTTAAEDKPAGGQASSDNKGSL